MSNSGEIDTLSLDNDWTVDVVMLNSVTVADGGIDTYSGGAINQAVMWLGLRTRADNYNVDGLLEITLQDHNDDKRIVAYSYDGNQCTDLSASSVAALDSYINRYPIAVEFGAESDNVQINEVVPQNGARGLLKL